MSVHGDSLRQLLRPLRVYELEGSVNGAELDAQGETLDLVEGVLEEIQREMLVCTAEDRGLEAIESLLARRPVTDRLEERRAALAALLRIGGDSFTLKAINDNLKGCGINAVAGETDTPGKVTVHFPNVPGIPDGIEEMKAIIESILPAHVLIEYVYWYVTCAVREKLFDAWVDFKVMGPPRGNRKNLYEEKGGSPRRAAFLRIYWEKRVRIASSWAWVRVP